MLQAIAPRFGGALVGVARDRKSNIASVDLTVIAPDTRLPDKYGIARKIPADALVLDSSVFGDMALDVKERILTVKEDKFENKPGIDTLTREHFSADNGPGEPKTVWTEETPYRYRHPMGLVGNELPALIKRAYESLPEWDDRIGPLKVLERFLNGRKKSATHRLTRYEDDELNLMHYEFRQTDRCQKPKPPATNSVPVRELTPEKRAWVRTHLFGLAE